MNTKKLNKFLNKRGPKTLIITLILFVIGLSSYLINKALEIGGWAVLTGIIIVWAILYFTRSDKLILR